MKRKTIHRLFPIIAGGLNAISLILLLAGWHWGIKSLNAAGLLLFSLEIEGIFVLTCSLLALRVIRAKETPRKQRICLIVLNLFFLSVFTYYQYTVIRDFVNNK